MTTYRMPLHVLEAVSEQLASLPLDVESWDHAHKLLCRNAPMCEPALTIDDGPKAMHRLHLF